MTIIISLIILMPLVLAALIAATPTRRENYLSSVILVFNVTYGILTLALVSLYILSGFKDQEFNLMTIVHLGDYDMKLRFLVDRYSVSFQFLIGLLSGLVFMFSRRYMHREPGYRRFFATLLLFLTGISTVALADSIDILFAGWEIVGLSSFLLIGFYTNRKSPGRNALRAFVIYRFCDVGLFVGAWLFHELGGEFTFLDFSQKNIDPALFAQHSTVFTAIGLLTLLAAMGKSAQYPFTFWVPRAMEGPTPSSAIFYGALSIHAGVYLLIRMYPVWHSLPAVNILTGVIGFVTLVTASLSAKTQSNIKGQIGYASVAQVGIMFVELSFGWRELAFVHFAGNAILRCYQLLASPSVLVIFLRLQNEGADLSKGVTGILSGFLSEKSRRRLFAISFSECYAENLTNLLVRILKWFAQLANRTFSYQFSIFILILIIAAITLGDNMPGKMGEQLTGLIIGGLAIHMALAAFGEEKSPVRVLNNAALSSFITGISTVFLAPEHYQHTVFFFAGIGIGYLLARTAIVLLPAHLLIMNYAGLAENSPGRLSLLLVGILFLSGFTLTPTFIGEDLLLHYGSGKYVFETFIIAGAFILNGITLMRMYVKLAYAGK